MSSRDKILKRVKRNQPEAGSAPSGAVEPIQFSDPLETFKETLVSIGGKVRELQDADEIEQHLNAEFPGVERIVAYADPANHAVDHPHAFRHVGLAVLRGEFAVAENGAVWLPEENMVDRVLPYISEHLILVLQRGAIVSNMHEAYSRIDSAPYGYGVFIAGPSKTADIEQSLVLGAHGPKSLTVLLIP